MLVWVFALLVLPSAALHSTKTITKNQPDLFERVFTFGFEKNASASFSYVRRASSSLHQLVVLNREQAAAVANLQTSSTPVSELCSLPFVRRFALGSSGDVQFTVPTQDLHTVYVLNCDQTPMSISLEYDLRNPQAGELSLDDEPLPAIYAAFLTCYGLLLLRWLSRIIVLRKSVVCIQWLCFATIFTFFVETLCGTHFYYTYKLEGLSNRGTNLTQRQLHVVGSCLLIITLFLTSSGAHIISPHPANWYLQILGGSVIFYGALGILYANCGGAVTCTSTFLGMKIAEFVLLFTMLIALNVNVERLRMAAPDVDMGEYDRPFPFELHLRHRVFRILRIAVVMLYFLFPLFIMFLDSVVLSWEQGWMEQLWPHIVSLSLLLVVSRYILPVEPAYSLVSPGHRPREDPHLTMPRVPTRAANNNELDPSVFDIF